MCTEGTPMKNVQMADNEAEQVAGFVKKAGWAANIHQSADAGEGNILLRLRIGGIYMPRALILIMLLAAFMLSACGKTASNNEGAPVRSSIIEPEQLISKQEAEDLLGEAVKDGEKREQPEVGQKICFYDMPYRDSAYFVQISITQAALMPASGQTVEDIYKTLKEALIETAEQKKIDGTGDEYFLGTPGLHILKEGYYICIAAGNLNDDRVLGIPEQAGVPAVNNLEKILSEVRE
jgi:hypothetical protein